MNFMSRVAPELTAEHTAYAGFDKSLSAANVKQRAPSHGQ
jgi:hypothetical protein